MQKIKDILQKKGSNVWTVAPNATVLDALKMMAAKDVGGLVVLDGDRIAGIVSERTVVRMIAETQECHLNSPVSNVMLRDVITTTPDQDVDACVNMMIQKNIRRLVLPVVDHNKLVGVVSIRDLVKEVMAERV
jgi:CBS domain-containing protein